MSVEAWLTPIRRKMVNPPRHYYQVAALGYEVYCLTRNHEPSDTDQVIREYRDYVNKYGYRDVIGHQMAYAIRLVQREDTLLDEEVHKLFSLCDEIESLQRLGLVVNEAEVARFQIELRAWFSNNSRIAHLVAKDLIEDWKKGWWWYAENL
jgi:hypothetical protein